MANTATWPLLLTPQASVLVSPVTSMLVYLEPFFIYPCCRPVESTYRPTTTPLSLIPIACVLLAFGKLTALNFPAEYTNAWFTPVVVLVHQPAAAPAELTP